MVAALLSSGKRVVSRLLGQDAAEGLAKGVHRGVGLGRSGGQAVEKLWWGAQGNVAFIKPYWGERELEFVGQEDSYKEPADFETLEAAFSTALDLREDQKAVFTGSGRVATELALRALKRGNPGRAEVILPSYGCRGNWDPVIRCGLKPVLVDMSPDLLTPPSEIIEQMSSKTLACILVHLCGKRMECTEVIQAAKERGVYAISDECQSLGSNVLFGDMEPEADFQVYSFGLGKNLMATAGGALVANSAQEQVAEQAQELGEQESDKVASRAKRILSTYFTQADQGALRDVEDLAEAAPSQFEFVAMSRLDALLLEAQLRRLPRILEHRINNASTLTRIMRKYPGVYGLQESDRHVYTKLSVVLQALHLVPAFRAFMARRNIELESMYTPLHLLDFAAPHVDRGLPVSEDTYLRVFNVPVRPNLQAKELARIAAALDKFGMKHETAVAA